MIGVMLWQGAADAGLNRRTATRVVAAFGIGWGAWVVSSALLADAEVYRFEPTKVAPWIAVGMMAPLAAALLFTRVPVLTRILSQPNTLWRLTMPQLLRVVGVTFLVVMALGQLPAVFALPAGLGDIAIGIEATFIARRLHRGDPAGHGRRVVWFNVLGLLDLVIAAGIGFTAAPGVGHLLIVSPTTQAISLLPIVLIPTTVVPLAATLHLLSLRKLWTLRTAAQIETGSALAGSAR